MNKVENFVDLFEKWNFMRSHFENLGIRLGFYNEIIFDIAESYEIPPVSIEWKVDNFNKKTFYIWAKWSKFSIVTTPDTYMIYDKHVTIGGGRYCYGLIKKDIIEVLKGNKSIKKMSENKSYNVLVQRDFHIA